jgi:hypothetical protein
VRRNHACCLRVCVSRAASGEETPAGQRRMAAAADQVLFGFFFAEKMMSECANLSWRRHAVS